MTFHCISVYLVTMNYVAILRYWIAVTFLSWFVFLLSSANCNQIWLCVMFISYTANLCIYLSNNQVFLKLTFLLYTDCWLTIFSDLSSCAISWETSTSAISVASLSVISTFWFSSVWLAAVFLNFRATLQGMKALYRFWPRLTVQNHVVLDHQ